MPRDVKQWIAGSGFQPARNDGGESFRRAYVSIISCSSSGSRCAANHSVRGAAGSQCLLVDMVERGHAARKELAIAVHKLLTAG